MKPETARPNLAADAESDALRARYALRVTVIGLVAMIVGDFFYAFLILQGAPWQIHAITGLTLTMTAADGAALVLIRRGRARLGTVVLMASLVIGVPLLSVLLAGFGIFLGINVLVVTALIAGQTLPARHAKQAIAAGMASCVASVLLDAWGSPGRLVVPELQTFIPLIAGAGLLALGLHAARGYAGWSLPAKAGVNLAVLIAAVSIVGAAGAAGLNNLNFQVDNLYNFMLIPINTIQDANLDLSEARESYRLIASGRLSPLELWVEVTRIQAFDEAFRKTLTQYDTEWVTTLSEPFTQVLVRNGRLSLQADEVEVLARVHRDFDAYLAQRDAAVPAILEGQLDLDELDSLDEAGDMVRSDMGRLIDINLQFAQVSFDDAVGSYQASTTAMMIVGVAVALLGLGLLIVLLRSIILPLNALRDTAGKVTAGQLDVTARVFARNEIGQVSATFNTMVARVRDLVSSLEARVAARTRDLELAVEVGRKLAQEHDLDLLLANAVESIRARFDLYYAQIYLTDLNGRSLALRAGTGSAGLELLRRSHRLPVGPGSINGRAASEQRAVIVADTAASGTFKPNPLLPDTRSEMAVPLIVGDQVVGVLDLQSATPGSLSEEQLPAFQALAGQLAVAVDNARLFAETEQARAEVERQARRLTREGWRQFLDAVHRSERQGYTFDRRALAPLTHPLPPADDAPTLDVPITVAGEPVGAIRLERDTAEGESWSQNDAQMVNAIAARVAQQVENLRLLAQAEQFRAEAETLTRRLTREGWEGYLRSKAASQSGYVYDLHQVAPLTPANGAREQADERDGDDTPALKIPLRVREELVGELAIEGVDRLEPATAGMVDDVVKQLAAHIENLRLTEEAQARAQRDQLVSEITARVHQSGDAESIMRTAVQEIGRALGRKAFIYLGEGGPERQIDAAAHRPERVQA